MSTSTTLSPVHQKLVDSVPLRPGAEIIDNDVAYTHADAPMEGYAAHDETIHEPKPAVLVIHDWTGLREYTKARSQMLARLGYFAFAADIYGAGRRFESHEDCQAESAKYYGNSELWMGRIQAAYDVLVKHPAVDPDRIAIIGFCFGGTGALEFSRTGAELVGTVALHAGLITHEPPAVEAIRGSVLVASGGSDPVVPDTDLVAFMNELRTRESLDWQVNVYSGAPHAFTVPGPSYREAADRRSWAELTRFLTEVF